MCTCVSVCVRALANCCVSLHALYVSVYLWPAVQRYAEMRETLTGGGRARYIAETKQDQHQRLPPSARKIVLDSFDFSCLV